MPQDVFLAAYTACFLPVPVCTSTVVQNMPVGDIIVAYLIHISKGWTYSQFGASDVYSKENTPLRLV